MKLIFKGIMDVRGLRLADKDQPPVTFSLGPAGDLIQIQAIKLKESSKPDVPPEHAEAVKGPPPQLWIKINDQEEGAPSLRVMVLLNVDVTKKAYRFVEGLLQNKYKHYGPNAPTLPLFSNKIERVTADGVVVIPKRIPFIAYPEPIKEICRDAENEITEIIQKFVGVICWRLGLEASPRIFDEVHLYWEIDQTQTFTLVARNRPVAEYHNKHLIADFGDDASGHIAYMWLESQFEPLGHELLREAIGLLSKSPRSALLVAVSALEAGVKAHIAAVAPDATWLVEELPSPPVSRILSEYIAKLHESKGKEMAFWKEFSDARTDVQKLIKLRNTLAHTGKFPKLEKDLSVYVRSVSDILYALDVLQGHEWAKERVQVSIKKKLKWKGYDKPSIRIAMSLIND